MVRSKEETGVVVERGLAIYEKDIAPQLSEEDDGRFIAVDVNSGEWEIGDTERVSEVLRARVPDAGIFVWRHPEVARGFVREFPPGMMRRLGITTGILHEASE